MANCDNKSVGQIIRQGDSVVMIERLNYPEAFALPAGHNDGISFEEAAKKESDEEVGAIISENRLAWKGTVDNPCKRDLGDHHDWEVFEALSWSGELKAGSDAKKYFLANTDRVKDLAARTEYFMRKFGISYDKVGKLTLAIFGDPKNKKTDPEWLADMGLEPVWYYILKKIGMI